MCVCVCVCVCVLCVDVCMHCTSNTAICKCPIPILAYLGDLLEVAGLLGLVWGVAAAAAALPDALYSAISLSYLALSSFAF